MTGEEWGAEEKRGEEGRVGEGRGRGTEEKMRKGDIVSNKMSLDRLQSMVCSEPDSEEAENWRQPEGQWGGSRKLGVPETLPQTHPVVPHSLGNKQETS